MKAGKTDIKVGTKIKTTKQWSAKLTEKFDTKIVIGTITHAFGLFGNYDYGAIAGIRIDKKYQEEFGEIGNLFVGDFEVIK